MCKMVKRVCFVLPMFVMVAVIISLPCLGQGPIRNLLRNMRGSSATEACPNGVCPNNGDVQWYNRDGMTPRAHVEHTHGMNTAGMSHADVLQVQNDYHNTYGSGHPVRQQLGSVISRVINRPMSGCSGQVMGCAGGQVITVTTQAPSPCPTGTCSLKESALPPQVTCIDGVCSIKESSLLAGVRRNDFRQALMKAAGNAHRNGDITILHYFAVAKQSLNPTKLAEMQQAVHESAVQEGLATVTAIDWDSLIAFIEKLIPIILKLIELFGYNVNDIQDFYVTSEGSTLIMNDGFSFFIAA